MSDVAFGFSVHLGWAAAVGIRITKDDPDIVERCRVALADPEVPESHEPYHCARGFAGVEAEGIVYQGTAAVRAVAGRAFRALVTSQRALGNAVVASAVVHAGGRLPDELERILAAHSLVHVAEGRLFRAALADASEAARVPAIGVSERKLLGTAEAALGRPGAALEKQVAALGSGLGAPWGKDQKLAALIAWLALASPGGRASA